MKRAVARGGLTGLLATGMATAMLAVMAPAYADTDLYATDYPGVWGDATVDYESAKKIFPIRMYVWDRTCDANDVYVRFRVYHLGGVWSSKRRYNSNGCGTSIQWNNLYIHDGRGIWGVQLVACVDSAGSDECDDSTIAYSPYVRKPSNAIIASRALETPVEPDGFIAYEGHTADALEVISDNVTVPHGGDVIFTNRLSGDHGESP